MITWANNTKHEQSRPTLHIYECTHTHNWNKRARESSIHLRVKKMRTGSVEVVLEYTSPTLHKATLCTFSCIYAWVLQPVSALLCCLKCYCNCSAHYTGQDRDWRWGCRHVAIWRVITILNNHQHRIIIFSFNHKNGILSLKKNKRTSCASSSLFAQ